VAQRLVGPAVDRPAGGGRGAGALDHLPAGGLGMAAGGDERAGGNRRPFRMLARAHEQPLAEAFEVDRQRREGVELGGRGGGKGAGHEGPPCADAEGTVCPALTPPASPDNLAGGGKDDPKAVSFGGPFTYSERRLR